MTLRLNNSSNTIDISVRVHKDQNNDEYVYLLTGRSNQSSFDEKYYKLDELEWLTYLLSKSVDSDTRLQFRPDVANGSSAFGEDVNTSQLQPGQLSNMVRMYLAILYQSSKAYYRA